VVLNLLLPSYSLDGPGAWGVGPGHVQETCRDLGHTSYGVAATFNAAQTALLQGTDLVGGTHAMTQRLAGALEFNANLLLKSPPGKDVCGGKVDLEYMPTFVVGYNALHNRLNISLPMTLSHIQENVVPASDPVGATGCH
jgi:hypothetical protein